MTTCIIRNRFIFKLDVFVLVYLDEKKEQKLINDVEKNIVILKSLQNSFEVYANRL